MRTTSRLSRRLIAVSTAGLLATAAVGLGASAAAAAPAGDAGAGATYLVSQLVDGTHLEFSGGFGPNYGGTADLAIALAAQDAHNATLATVTAYLRSHVADYADPAGTLPDFPGPYTGAAAKLALLAEITGQNPASFGGFNLLTTLTSNVCTVADDLGVCTAPGDFSQNFSTVSQALGVLALARAGVTVPAPALARLEQLQCSDGGFSSELLTAGQTCTSDPDTTGYALQALVLIPAASTQAAAAVHYFESTQQADGGFIGTAGENTNSTALAIQALTSAGTGATNIAAAQSWLAGFQNTDGGFGISTAVPATDTLATAQVVPAIVGAALSTLTDPVDLDPGTGSSGSSGPTAPPTSPTSPTGSTSTSQSSSPTDSSTSPSESSTSPSGGSSDTASTSTSSGGVDATSETNSTGGTGGLASTGTDSSQWLTIALALLVAGALVTAAGSRRVRAAFSSRGRH